jgi:hypothetical protein
VGASESYKSRHTIDEEKKQREEMAGVPRKPSYNLDQE